MVREVGVATSAMLLDEMSHSEHGLVRAHFIPEPVRSNDQEFVLSMELMENHLRLGENVGFLSRRQWFDRYATRQRVELASALRVLLISRHSTRSRVRIGLRNAGGYPGAWLQFLQRRAERCDSP